MTRPLIWYEEQESGIELGELWDLLARHGFVEGLLSGVISEQRRQIEAFAADLHVELVRSEVERMRRPPPDACAELTRQELEEGFGETPE